MSLTELSLQLGKLESRVNQIEYRINGLYRELDKRKPSLNKSKVLDKTV